MLVKYTMKHGASGTKAAAREAYLELRYGRKRPKLQEQDSDALDAGERLLVDDDGALDAGDGSPEVGKLSLRETAWLSLEFCMLWFAANYFASACLEYTSVGSVTIFTSLSSMFTLLFCALMKVEGFTTRKLIGVLASLAGVALISTVDLSGQSDENRGNFPHKSQVQILIGDSMALFSAVIYGVYVTVMKSRVGNEDRVNMPLFFGLVGLFNVLFLWPGFIILHVVGVETVGGPFLARYCCRPANQGAVRTPAHREGVVDYHCKTPATCRTRSWRFAANHAPAQLALVVCERHVVGVRHAPHDAPSSHGGPVADDPALANRGDDPVCPVLQLGILGRRVRRGALVPIYQPREPRGGFRRFQGAA